MDEAYVVEMILNLIVREIFGLLRILFFFLLFNYRIERIKVAKKS